MFIFSPQDKKKIAEIIKITPFKSLWKFLIPCVVTWMIHVFFVLWWLFHESLVCSEQLNWALQKNPQALQNRQFPCIFCIFENFPAVDYDFEINILTLSVIEGLKHNYQKRFKHSLMLQKETLLKGVIWRISAIFFVLWTKCKNILLRAVLNIK